MRTDSLTARDRMDKPARSLTTSLRRALAWWAKHPGSTLQECARGLGMTKHGAYDRARVLRAMGLLAMPLDGKARQMAITDAGCRALGVDQTCTACRRPFAASSDCWGCEGRTHLRPRRRDADMPPPRSPDRPQRRELFTRTGDTMTTKKKTAKKTAAPRPPKQVWAVVNDSMDPKHQAIAACATTRARALDLCEDDGDRVVGPYVLAERVRQR